MRVIAVGTPAFALPAFEALRDARDVEIAQVVTKAERPGGRGLKPIYPPAYEWATENGLPIVQLEKFPKAYDQVSSEIDATADAVVVVASAFFVPAWLRDPQPEGLTKFGAVNLHPSLLPELRGPAPVNWAIIEGYDETGVTTIRLAEELDAGDILLQERVDIAGGETAGTLAEKLAQLGARAVLDTLRGLARGEIEPRAQDTSEAHILYRPKITAEVRAVSWSEPAERIERLVRGLYPDAPARASFSGELLQILAAEPAGGPADAAPGTITAVAEDGVVVACGEGALKLVRVKPAGRGEMSAHAFALGRRLAAGARFD
jgi:methionyl-tRNA formyltransferase